MSFSKKTEIIINSQLFKTALAIIAIGLGALLIFEGGVFVGYRKATFSYRWGENYHRNFGGPRGGLMPFSVGDDFVNPHGTFGQIIKADFPTFTVQAPHEAEKVIRIGTDTVIRDGPQSVSPEMLTVGQQVVVIGEPNNAGEIEAKLVRLLPPLESATNTQSSSQSQ